MAGYYDRDLNTSGSSPYGGTHYPSPHHGMVSEYQQSGIPFVYYKAVGGLSGNKIVQIEFPHVTRWLKVKIGGTLTAVKVGFGDYDGTSDGGVQGSNHILPATLNAITVPLELKCKKLLVYVPDAVNDLTIEVIAGMTNVREFPDLSQRNLLGITTEAEVLPGVLPAIYSVLDPTS